MKTLQIDSMFLSRKQMLILYVKALPRYLKYAIENNIKSFKYLRHFSIKVGPNSNTTGHS